MKMMNHKMEEKQEAAGAGESTAGNETDQQQEETATEGAGEATEGTEDTEPWPMN